MNYLDQKKGFLGYDAILKKKTRVVVIPFGLEKTVSYGSGTKNGPKEILKAYHQVELYDEELNIESYKKIGIQTLKPFPILFLSETELNFLDKIYKLSFAILKALSPLFIIFLSLL